MLAARRCCSGDRLWDCENFGGVRYPYATSIFQQGFNNHVIHSETDYKVYKEAGLRGLDLAFYKPRDKYHTGRIILGM